MKKDYSDEQLNAFVDGELEPEEKSHLFKESNRSAELDQRLCQQRKIKELVKHAYEDVPRPDRESGAPLSPSSLISRALVAGFLLVLGVSGGFVAHNYFDQLPENKAIVEVEAQNYILHVASGEPEQMLVALDMAQELLDSAADGQPRQVEIVANERGLNLLRSDVTPYADKISTLQDSNVIFYACSRTIERLEEKGVEVHLVPETNFEYTALDRVVLRMKDHWEYIKI